jgi:hypothetical protein
MFMKTINTFENRCEDSLKSLGLIITILETVKLNMPKVKINMPKVMHLKYKQKN